MKAWRICIQNIRKWSSNRRVILCLCFAVLFVYNRTVNIGDLSRYIGEKVSPWIFPFLFSARYVKIILMAPLVFIFCDAPFIDRNQPYVMLRTSRNTWSVGQILYVVFASLLYTLVLLVSSVLIHIGHLEWNSSWGNVLGAAANTSILPRIGKYSGTIKVTPIVIRYYTPFQAMLWSFIIMWMSFIFVGLLIYVLNLVTKTKLAGVLCAGFLILFTAVADQMTRLTWLSPISWNCLANIDVANTTRYPSIGFVTGMYFLMTTVLAVVAVLAGKRQEVIVREEQ